MLGFLKSTVKKWLKVHQLKVGTRIAVPRAGAMAGFDKSVTDDSLLEKGSGDYMWDEIVEIKKVGRERVYDIEVDGTHNFIAGNMREGKFRGLFAHNTYTSGVYSSSDENWKNAITTLSDNTLDKVNLLDPVSYTWDLVNYPNKGFEEGTQIGFIAQQVEPIFPELVHTDSAGYKSLAYEKFTPILAKAIQELSLKKADLTFITANQIIIDQKFNSQETRITNTENGLDFLNQKLTEDINGNLTIDATGSVIATNDLLDATVQGLATKVIPGVVTDADFANTVNGLMAVDSANGRVYFRYANPDNPEDAGSWHYITQTGGFQIPNYETAPYEELSHNAKNKKEEALPFEQSNYPHYLTEKLTPGELMIPYVDEYLPDGAVHGLYARFEDVKEKMFGREKEQLLELALKTTENIETVKELKISIDKNLAIVSANFEKLDSDLTQNTEDIGNLEVRLATQENETGDLSGRVSVLEMSLSDTQLANERMEFLTQILNPAEDGSLTIYNDLALEGELDAEGVITSMLAIKNMENEAPVIGEELALPEALTQDADLDGRDDVTGAKIIGEEGITALTVPTTAITETCKIFTSFESDPGGTSWVEKIYDAETGQFTGFVIRFSEPVLDRTKVSWWIVEKVQAMVE